MKDSQIDTGLPPPPHVLDRRGHTLSARLSNNLLKSSHGLRLTVLAVAVALSGIASASLIDPSQTALIDSDPSWTNRNLIFNFASSGPNKKDTFYATEGESSWEILLPDGIIGSSFGDFNITFEGTPQNADDTFGLSLDYTFDNGKTYYGNIYVDATNVDRDFILDLSGEPSLYETMRTIDIKVAEGKSVSIAMKTEAVSEIGGLYVKSNSKDNHIYADGGSLDVGETGWYKTIFDMGGDVEFSTRDGTDGRDTWIYGFDLVGLTFQDISAVDNLSAVAAYSVRQDSFSDPQQILIRLGSEYEMLDLDGFAGNLSVRSDVKWIGEDFTYAKDRSYLTRHIVNLDVSQWQSDSDQKIDIDTSYAATYFYIRDENGYKNYNGSINLTQGDNTEFGFFLFVNQDDDYQTNIAEKSFDVLELHGDVHLDARTAISLSNTVDTSYYPTVDDIVRTVTLDYVTNLFANSTLEGNVSSLYSLLPEATETRNLIVGDAGENGFTLGENFQYLASATGSGWYKDNLKWVKIDDTHHNGIELSGVGLTAYVAATLKDKIEDNKHIVYADLRYSGVRVDEGAYFYLGQADLTTGSSDSPWKLGDWDTDKQYSGISGEGGIVVSGDVYLGGTNTFTGETVIQSDSTLHVAEADALKGSKVLVVEGNATFDSKADFIFDEVYFVGGNAAGDNTTTVIGNQDVQGSITVKGEGRHISFFQSNKGTGEGTVTMSETTEGAVPHHVVEVVNTELNVLDGAAFWVNHLGENARNSVNGTEMAVMQLGAGSSLNVSGASGNDSSATSSHIYLGNGILQVQKGATLTLGADSAIHFSSHMDGFFEFGGSEQDPHHHASIEVEQGGTANMVLGMHNHIYADSILVEGHEHYLLGTAWEERGEGSSDNGYYYNDRNITFQVTQDTWTHLQDTIRQVEDGTYENPLVTKDQLKSVNKFFTAMNEANVSVIESAQNLAQLKEKLAEQGLTEEDFNEALGTLVTIGMDNKHHNSWQDYKIVSDRDGIYMTVSNTKQWGDLTDVWLSLQTSTNEAVQISASSQGAELAGTSGAYEIVMGAVNGFTVDPASGKGDFLSAARMIDASGQLATVGGAQTIAWDMQEHRRDSLINHMYAARNEHSTKLWADVLMMRNKSFDMWNDLNGERDVDTNLSGFIMGVDSHVRPNWLLGAAFSYMGGDSTTNLGLTNQVSTTNEVDGYAVSLYSSYALTENDRIVGDIGVQWAQNRLNMAFPQQSGITDSLKANVDTTSVQFNLRYEHSFPILPQLSVTPFAGVQYTYLTTEGYTSKLGGKNAWHTERADQHVFSIPVGLRFSGLLENKGTQFHPVFSAYVQPNFGDTEVENVVRGEGLASVDTVRPEVIGEWSYGATLGLAIDLSERFTFGVDYSFHGSNQSRNNALKASMQYAF